MSENLPESVGLDEVRTLHRAELISRDEYLDAAYFCRDRAFWTRWSLRVLLALGVGHALAGIIFFFAYNWDDLSTTAKFAILESGVVLTALLALVLGPDKPAGKAFLISATVLVGVLLAVIGQVYQTGADAWHLFAWWALLTLPWVLVSRSAGHWLVWLIVAYFAGNLYGYQVLVIDQVLRPVELQCLISVAIALVLVVREAAVLGGMTWLDSAWTRAVLAFGAIFIVFWFAAAWVLDWDGSLGATALFIGLLAVLTFVYARVLPDFSIVAISTGFAALFMMAVGSRLIGEVIGFDEIDLLETIFGLLLLLLWCAAVTTVTLKFLAFARERIPEARADG